MADLPDIMPDAEDTAGTDEVSGMDGGIIDGEYRELDEKQGGKGDMEKAAGPTAPMRKFRGGYGLAEIDRLLTECQGFMDIALPEKEADRIGRCSCLLDALELLRDTISEREG